MSAHFVKRGRLVWGKIGRHCWWPGMVISGEDCGHGNAVETHAWIYWFGDHRFSEVSLKMVRDFFDDYSLIDAYSEKKIYRKALYEVLHEISLRINNKFSVRSFELLLDWGANKFIPHDKSADICAISPQLSGKLKLMKEKHVQNVEKAKESKEALVVLRKGSAALRVRQNKVSQRNICIACDDPNKVISCQHPLFEGGLCADCKPAVFHVAINLPPGKFTGLCIICGQGGNLVICDSKACYRSYCRLCIECLASPEHYQQVLKTKPWLCYLCYEDEKVNTGLISKKTTDVSERPHRRAEVPALKTFKKKKPIKVISFNEIGKAVLDRLEFCISGYYILYPPTDPLPSAFSPGITLLGNMDYVDNNVIKSLHPVDLVIGLTLKSSLNFPAARELAFLKLSGIFYQFCRVTSIIYDATERQKKIFWLFVLDVQIGDELRHVVTHHMKCDPFIITIRLNQAYYAWTNIPYAESIAADISAKADLSSYVPSRLDLDMAEKDEEDILEAFLSPLIPYFKTLAT